MRICELNITEFGCLKNCRILPESGLNLLEGENESGKSTVLLFIKFMLYGIARRRAGDDGEHDRSISWQGHLAEGSMVIETATGRYRIARSHMELGGRKKGTECRVTDLADGSELTLSCEPGEHFLGVPREVFESTAAVGQMRCARLDGEKTATALGNLLLAADESVDVARVLKRMDEVRSDYYHKRGTGGRLSEKNLEVAELRTRMDRATGNALRLRALESALAEDRTRREETLAKLERLRTIRDQQHDATVLCRFEALGERKTALEAQRDALAALEAAETVDGFCPTEMHVAALRESLKSESRAKEAEAMAVAEVERESRETVDPERVAAGEALALQGGAAAVLGRLDKIEKKRKGRRGGALCLLILSLLAGGVGAALWLFGRPAIAYGAFGGAGLGLLLFACLLVLSVKAGKEKQALTASYGQSAATLGDYLAACEEAVAEDRRHRGRLETATAQLGFARAHAARMLADLKRMLAKTLRGEPADACAAASEEIGRLERFCREREALLREIDGISRWIRSEEQALSEYDEQLLRDRVTVEIHSVTRESVEEAKRRCAFEEERLRKLEEALQDKEKEKLSLLGSDHDPLAIGDRLAQKSEELARDRAYCDALDLAMAALKTAEEAMRGNVTPELTRRAGEWLRTVSDGRYDTVRTTKELQLSMEQDGYPVSAETVSGGTRELAYLALRLALMGQIYRQEMPPLLLDEALCQIDDGRAARALSLLSAACTDGLQVLLFTCHTRERTLCQKLNISANTVEM